MDGITSLVWGATGLILAVYIALIAAGIIGAICSIIGLVRGITNHNTTAIAVGGVGVGCAVLGIFVLPIVFWIACFVCGTMACQLSKQQHVLSYEEFKRQKAMLEDPEYAEYMRNVHGVEDVSGMTLEQKFDRDVAAQASMQKHGGKVKRPMSGGKVGAIVLIVFAVLAVCAFAFGSAVNNGTFDHLGGAPAVEQEEGVHTIEDLGDGTILFLPEHQ